MASPSLTYTFTNGTVIDASQVNTNFNDIIAALTDSTKDLDVADITATTGTITSTLTVSGTTSSASFLATSLGSLTAAAYSFTGDPNTGMYSTGADVLVLVRGGQAALTMATSGGLPYLTSSGTLELGNRCGIGGGNTNIAILALGLTNPLNQTRQIGALANHTATSDAIHPSLALIGYYSVVTTAASSFTCPNRYAFYGDGTAAKGSGSTITNDTVYGGLQSTQGTNNAFLADTGSYTGSYFIHQAGSNPSVLTGYLMVQNQADPGAVTDGIRIGSVDLSAGNATLSLRTETAVVTESVTSDRTLSVQINGTTYKICLKV